MPKKKPVIEEPEEEPEEVIEEEVTCPVCGKPVGLEVMSCPYCGAEFEAEEEEVAEVREEEPVAEEPEVAAPVVTKPAVAEKYVEVEEEETAECPVCGKMVSLYVSSCPSCGAEFEEEEVEEIIEVEEKPKAQAKTYVPQIEEVIEEVPEEEEVEVEEEAVEMEGPSSIMDFRVIGISLIVLGVVGSQIAFMIDWYWTWVPPIEDNLGMFIAIPAVIIVVGLLAFLLVKRALAGGRRVSGSIPGMSLSMFLFGILALVMVMLWDPINAALRDSSAGVGTAFVMMLVVGALVMYMGMRSSSRASAG